MIAELLPSNVGVAARFDDAGVSELFPDELVAVQNATEVRRREFATGRACARDALAMLGFPPVGIPIGERGAPVWPAGALGSITHCAGYRACVVGRSEEMSALGIDAEPNEPLPAGLLSEIALPQEITMVQGLVLRDPDLCWDRLLFCAKEATYKTWYPIVGAWLDFHEAMVQFNVEQRQFHVRLLVRGPVVDGQPLGHLRGRWDVREGILLAAIALPKRTASRGDVTLDEPVSSTGAVRPALSAAERK